MPQVSAQGRAEVWMHLLQVAGEVLHHCMYSVQGYQLSFPALHAGATTVTRAHELAVAGLMGTQPFQTVLRSLVPPRLRPLASLTLSRCQLPEPGMLEGCSALHTVTDLLLKSCSSPTASFSSALAALLGNIPRLEQLTVEACLEPEDPFPACLQALSGPGPTFLSLRNNSLSDLPEGCSWEGEARQY